jgi:predicted alpha/beta hydrolase
VTPHRHAEGRWRARAHGDVGPAGIARPFQRTPDASNPRKRHLDTMAEHALPVPITADDGYVLRGTYFAANPRCPQRLAAVVNCGAGIPARHYRRFAEYLASAGIAVLTYDYRGIGASRPPAMRHFAATIEDWAEHDCRAAIDWLRARCPDATLVGIGHSVGGVLFGGAPNAHALARFVMLGAHTGYYGD